MKQTEFNPRAEPNAAYIAQVRKNLDRLYPAWPPRVVEIMTTLFGFGLSMHDVGVLIGRGTTPVRRQRDKLTVKPPRARSRIVINRQTRDAVIADMRDYAELRRAEAVEVEASIAALTKRATDLRSLAAIIDKRADEAAELSEEARNLLAEARAEMHAQRLIAMGATP